MAEADISMKNSKAEILEALNQAKQRLERAERARLNPEKTEKENTERRAVESAKKAVEQNIFSKELNDRFNDLQTAIAAEERRLQELYGVGREVQKLALVIEAARDRVAEIDAAKAEKESAAKVSLESLRSEYAQKHAELQAEYDTTTKKMKLERTRENEEYQYNLTRAREKETNAWADEKAAREAELQRREARAAELLAEAEAKAEYIRSLEERVEGIPQLLATERESAIAAVTDELNREHKHQSALQEMESKNAVLRLEDKLATLEKQLVAANKSVELMQNKLDKAYSEMRDLATKTVEATGGLKILGNPEKSPA